MSTSDKFHDNQLFAGLDFTSRLQLNLICLNEIWTTSQNWLTNQSPGNFSSFKEQLPAFMKRLWVKTSSSWLSTYTIRDWENFMTKMAAIWLLVKICNRYLIQAYRASSERLKHEELTLQLDFLILRSLSRVIASGLTHEFLTHESNVWRESLKTSLQPSSSLHSVKMHPLLCKF